MKEASGEANMTVITIILIGVIAAVAIPLVKNTMDSIAQKAECTNQGMCVNDAGDGCVECQ